MPTKLKAHSLAPSLPLPLIEPVLVEQPPSGALWAHEIKWDGWRVQACLTLGKATLYTRQGNDCTKRFPSIAAAMVKLKAADVVLDGEAVAIDDQGRSDFHAVLGAGARVSYKAFDVLWLDDADLRPQSWTERNRVLRKLLGRLPKAARDTLSYVEPVHGDGAKVYASACKLGLEGVVSKRVDTPYRAGRSDYWLKCRCAVVETVAVVGFRGAKRINGLHVARAEKGELVYAGLIEHGLSAVAVGQLEAVLRPLSIDRSPFLKTGRGIAVTPGVLVDISHRGVTGGGVMRHPRFFRLRTDLASATKGRRPR